MVDAKTLNDERWTPYVVSGQQYWVRAVHYYGAWLISVVNLDRQCSQATDGMLAFAQPDGVLLAGTRPEEGELSHYISLTAETEGLVLEYYVPSTDMDLDNAMNLALAVGITAVLAAICFVIWYLCSNVVHPLDALVDAMRRISAGDLSVRADWNPVNLELQQVKEAFNVMLNEIETLKIEQYEQKLDAERQEMAALKMQIRPHFFLNNLKLIYALAETGQTQQIQQGVAGYNCIQLLDELVFAAKAQQALHIQGKCGITLFGSHCGNVHGFDVLFRHLYIPPTFTIPHFTLTFHGAKSHAFAVFNQKG